MVTESKTEQAVEEILKGDSSPEQEEVSEETTEEVEEVEKPKVTEAKKPDDIQARVDAEVDRRTNLYREKLEASNAYTRSLSSQLKEERSKNLIKDGDKRIEAILSGDEEEGITPEDTLNREKALKDFNLRYKDYKEKSIDVEETAQVIDEMAKKMSASVVKEFGLDDPNPHIRAVNGVKFLDKTVSAYEYAQNFLLVMGGLLPKEDEFRKQIEGIVDGMAEFKDEKSQKLYLKTELQGVKINRRKPPTPSDGSGGKGMPESAKGKIQAGWEELHKSK